MSRETDTLIVKRVKWRALIPEEAASSVDVASPIHLGIDWVEVECKQCGNEWTATSGIVPGPSHFHEVVGELLLLCSECGMQHLISEKAIHEN